MENKERFEQLYNRLYDENFSELEKLRKEDEKIVKKILKIIGLIFFIYIVFELFTTLGFINVFKSDGQLVTMLMLVALFIIGGPFIVLITFILVGKIFKISKASSVVGKKGTMFEQESIDKRTYKNVFKQKIITPMIKLALCNSEYYHNVGLTEEEYNRGDWEKYDTYDSEDKIVTSINVGENKNFETQLIMSEVHTEDIRRDSDGDTNYVTLFHGLAGYIKLPENIGCYIKVVKNKINLFGKADDNIQMDMSEFEKIFDVETDDKIKAMQILTVDIMAELIQLIEMTKVKFEFYINHNKLYIRFHTGEVFEPEVFGKAMQYEQLKKYFDIVSNVKNITERICTVILNTEL